jgi:hypothetical protein
MIKKVVGTSPSISSMFYASAFSRLSTACTTRGEETMPLPSLRWKNNVRYLILCLLLFGFQGCAPVTLMTHELEPSNNVATGTSGFAGSKGFCTSDGHPPPSGFSPIPGAAMVGFDNFFRAGTQPFPCDVIRAAIFRGGILFNLNQFDSIFLATLTFDSLKSASRSGGNSSVIESPPISHATTLGIATENLSSKMLFDNDASLPSGPSINANVTSQVRDWVDQSRPNFGFVIAGPREVDKANPPRDNDAQISWYNNFRLRIVYNPALNARAPQPLRLRILCKFVRNNCNQDFQGP